MMEVPSSQQKDSLYVKLVGNSSVSFFPGSKGVLPPSTPTQTATWVPYIGGGPQAAAHSEQSCRSGGQAYLNMCSVHSCICESSTNTRKTILSARPPPLPELERMGNSCYIGYFKLCVETFWVAEKLPYLENSWENMDPRDKKVSQE